MNYTMQPLTLSLSLLCGLLVFCWSVQAQDKDIESLAKVVCETSRGTKRQISHVSHVSQLVLFFQGLTGEHKLYPCRNLFLESLEDLENVISTANDDACGEEKIKLIEDYHHKYVSKVSKHVRQQKKGNKAPKMVKLLFMQYANQLSSICEEAAVSFVEKHHRAVSHEELTKIDGLRKFTDALGMSEFDSGFTGVYLFWNMVESLGLESDKKFSKYLEVDGSFRLNIQMREARNLRGVQALCRNKLKPFYSKSVLPVLRLVDMGYYPQKQRLLVDDPKMRPIFLASQICETLLPVQVFEDEKLTSNQFVALTKEEASRLNAPKEIEGLGEVESVEVVPVSTAHMDDLVNQGTGQVEIENIKANVASRSKIVRRMLRNVLKQLKAKIGSALGKSVLFKRGSNKQLELVGEESLDKIDEDQLLQPSDDDSDEDEAVATSNKRLKRGWGFALFCVGYMIYTVALVIIKIILLTLPTIILLLTAAFSNSLGIESESALYMVEYMWKFGFDPTKPVPDDMD